MPSLALVSRRELISATEMRTDFATVAAGSGLNEALRVLDRITANQLCKQAGLEPKF